MGLCNLKYIDEIIAKREKLVALYDQLLNSKLTRLVYRKNIHRNNAYYPIIFESQSKLLKAMSALKAKHIFPRRYFYPSLNTLPYVEATACPVSEDISTRIACLPLYADLSEDKVAEISGILNKI
jgi:dTDP-4-amino-4,6-dideoxygalactose transaminase